MSLEAMLWALRVNAKRHNVSDAAQLTLIALANNANSEGKNAFPSVGTLAVLRSLHVRTLHRHLKELEDATLIRRGDDRLVSHIPPNRRPVVWDLALTPVPGVTDMSPQNPFWGDTYCASDMTPGVIQTVIEPSYLRNLSGTDTRGRARRTPPQPAAQPDEEYPGKDCDHGIEAVKQGAVWKCPYCRKRGYVQLAPEPKPLTPEQEAQVEQFKAQIRASAQERANERQAHRR